MHARIAKASLTAAAAAKARVEKAAAAYEAATKKDAYALPPPSPSAATATAYDDQIALGTATVGVLGTVAPTILAAITTADASEPDAGEMYVSEADAREDAWRARRLERMARIEAHVNHLGLAEEGSKIFAPRPGRPKQKMKRKAEGTPPRPSQKPRRSSRNSHSRARSIAQQKAAAQSVAVPSDLGELGQGDGPQPDLKEEKKVRDSTCMHMNASSPPRDIPRYRYLYKDALFDFTPTGYAFLLSDIYIFEKLGGK